MGERDSISRQYAITQVEIAIAESASEGERETFQRFKGFLSALPCIKELEQQVYCTECEHLSISPKYLHCPYDERCYFFDPEDSAPRSLRCCYSPKTRELDE